MGCNTSKESAPLPEDKEKHENGEIKGGDADNSEDVVEKKSASAKTITLKGNRPNSVREEVAVSGAIVNEEDAATKIQAAFRGHKTRKSMKQADRAAPSEPEPSQEQLRAEFREDDKELCNAATKIQASFRGHMSRKTGGKDEPGTANHPQKPDDEELDIDLSDPELNKAAVKIQASFRGHMVRKENEDSSQ